MSKKVVRKSEVEVKSSRGVEDVAEYVRREYAETLDRIYNPEKYKKKGGGGTESTKLEQYLDPEEPEEQDGPEEPEGPEETENDDEEDVE